MMFKYLTQVSRLLRPDDSGNYLEDFLYCTKFVDVGHLHTGKQGQKLKLLLCLSANSHNAIIDEKQTPSVCDAREIVG